MGKSKAIRDMKKNFKSNQGKSMKTIKRENLIPLETIEVEVKENLRAYVDTAGRFFQKAEVVELVKDIFVMKKKINKNEVIKMSEVCDTYLDFKFLGSKLENGITNAYLNIC